MGLGRVKCYHMCAAGRLVVAVGSKVALELSEHRWRLGYVSFYHFVSWKTVETIKGELLGGGVLRQVS